MRSGGLDTHTSHTATRDIDMSHLPLTEKNEENRSNDHDLSRWVWRLPCRRTGVIGRQVIFASGLSGWAVLTTEDDDSDEVTTLGLQLRKRGSTWSLGRIWRAP